MSLCAALHLQQHTTQAAAQNASKAAKAAHIRTLLRIPVLPGCPPSYMYD
jgi:hypothetical protein